MPPRSSTTAARSCPSCQKGQTKELQPIPLEKHPALRELVATVDYEELTSNNAVNTAATGGRT